MNEPDKRTLYRTAWASDCNQFVSVIAFVPESNGYRVKIASDPDNTYFYPASGLSRFCL